MKNSHHKNSVQKEYSQMAQEYDDKWSFYVNSTIKETLKRIEIKAGQSLLDIGCGTGILLESLEKTYPDIMLSGIDPTQEMLNVAKNRLSKKVYVEKGWAEKLPFDSEMFDTIVSCNMFHYIREPTVALEEALRVLKPAGRLIITDWCDDYITCRICDLFLRTFNDAHYKMYKKRGLYHLLFSSDFTDIKIDSYKINWLWGMMTAIASKN